MKQLNINLDPTTEKQLRQLMRAKSIRTKSEAVRLAIAEAAKRARRGGQAVSYSDWLGLGKRVNTNRKPRFSTEDDLWTSS